MFKQGDILIIPLPFTDLQSQKRRPVLVLSNDSYNATVDDLIVAAITSNPSAKPYATALTNKDMKDGKLKVDSYIRADKIYTLSQSIVVKRFGTANQEIVENVIAKLVEVLKN